jgi:valyl-tRNA synthetase
MSQVFEFTVFIVLALIVFSLAYGVGHFFFVSKKMAISFLESQAQVEALLNKIQELRQSKEEQGVEQSKAFIGFISESREKAFEYIEDIQSSIQQIKNVRETLDLPLSEISEADLEVIRNVLDNVLKHLPSEDGV